MIDKYRGTLCWLWYITGDMGYLAEGELYVTGRKKDLIIVGGKNIYPQDLKAITNSTPGVYPGRAVAFGVSDERIGSEAVIMVCEVDDNHQLAEEWRLEHEIRRRVVQESAIALGDVRLVSERWIIKTSSGKIARSQPRQVPAHVCLPAT